MSKTIKTSNARKLFNIINFFIMVSIVIVTIYPFINMFAVSFSSKTAVMAGRVALLPVEFNTESYMRILKEAKFWTGYRNTLIYTVLGTFLAIIMTTACAYPLSRKNLPGRKSISLFMIFTMYFGGGLIPNFLLINQLHIYNTIWAIILPGSISVYNMLVMRTFFMGISDSLIEAAQIDGLGHARILTKIVLPLSKPIIATMALFYAVGHWNDWFAGLLYLSSSEKQPVTLFLRDVVMGVKLLAQSGQAIDASQATMVISETLQAATVMLVTIPILCIYPFVQKYFVSGVMIGAVKE